MRKHLNKIIYLFAHTQYYNMNKDLHIPYIDLSFSAIEKISNKLDNHKKNTIHHSPWESTIDITADFAIAHSDEAILLKFFVTEEHVAAIYNQPNDAVYKDSCVEFFMAFPGDAAYYNFEFNCKGNCHVGFGESRENRTLIPLPLIKDIKTLASFKTVYINHKAMINWELSIAIPFSSMWRHVIKSLKNQEANMNFYKCGDDLPQPHYLCWNPIESSEPNFHLPEFFGEAIFES